MLATAAIIMLGLPLQQSHSVDEHTQEQAQALRAAVLRRFHTLQSSHALKINGGANDLTEVVTQYVSTGSPFPDAATVLTGAGLCMFPQTALSAMTNEPGRRLVYAGSKTMLAWDGPGSEVTVQLELDTTINPERIVLILAYITTTML